MSKKSTIMPPSAVTAIGNNNEGHNLYRQE